MVKNVSCQIKNFKLIFAFIFLIASSAFSANYTTYQAKIVKPDGHPLEANSVNFKFTILNPAGTCILYSETYSSVNMSNSGGIISFSLGSGVKTYPVSSTTFFEAFNNGIGSLSCDVGGPVSYNPNVNDTRKIVMQFHDGSGWQTLPAMAINAVPYAMYANDSQSLGGVSATSYVRYSTIPTCSASQALQYNGASFNCVAVPDAGNFTAGDVAAALSYTPANSASVTTLSSSLASANATISSVSSTVASVSSTVFSVSSTVTGLSNSVSAITTTVSNLSASMAAFTSSQWVTSGTKISYTAGNVGIGTTNPAVKLEVSGAVRISMDSSSCSAGLAGTLRYNAGAVEYCNGVAWAAFGVSGAGLQGLNGSVSGTQSFATGTTGTTFNVVTANGVHTFNIPLASAGSVTGGLLSNADYTTFMGKITSSAAAVSQVLGYAPVSTTTLGNYVLRSNNLSDLTSSATARTNLGLGTFATASSVDLGSASATGTLAAARLPSFAGDVTSVSGSNSLTLANSGVTSGTYTKVTVDTKGRVISGTQLTNADVVTALGFTPGAAASGVTSLNGSTSQTQTFATGTAGTAPAFTTAAGVHTLNIPLASAASVTGGLLSNADYTTFTGYAATIATLNSNLAIVSSTKVTSSAAAIAQVLGYTPASATQLSNFLVKANNLSDLTNSATARTNLGVGYIGTLSAVDLSSADVSGTLAIARTPAYAGDVTKAAASNTLILSNSGVTAGTYNKVTVDAKGRVTSSSALNVSDVTTALGYTPASATASTQWTTSATAIYYNSGNVGIGTVNPSAQLEVNNSGNSVKVGFNTVYGVSIDYTGGAGWAREYGFSHSGNKLASFGFTGTASSPSYIYLNANQASSSTGYVNPHMVITSSGNVGIGTTNPTAKLYLPAGTSATASLKFASGTLTSSAQAGSLEYDGNYYYITDNANTRRAIATVANPGTFDNASTITATGNITMAPNSSVVISSTTQSTSSSTGALVVNGGVGVSGNIYSSGTIVTSSNIQGASLTATYGIITPYLAGGTASGGGLIIDSTTHASKGKVLINGNVGLGITNPDEQLHLSKVLKFTNTVGVNQFRAPTADSFRIFAHDDAGTGNQYGTGDNNAKIFENVDGNNSTPDDGFFFVNHGTSGPVTALSILGNGYVGLNNSSPGAILEIGKNTASSSSIRFSPSNADQSSMRFTANSSANYIQSGFDYTSDSKKDLKFTSVGGVSTWMTIQASTGNVGIGALTPTASLNVIGQPIGFPASAGTATSGVIMRLENSGSQLAFDFGGNTGNGNWIQSTNKTNLANTYPLMLNPNGGNVGIGTTAPTSKLYIKGIGSNSSGFAVYSPNANQGLDIMPGYALDGTATGLQEDLTATIRSSGSSSGNLAFGTGNTERMRLTSTGNFGIGTSAPTQKLDVSGTAKATAFIGDGSGLTNISAANLTFYNYPSGYASGAVPFSSFSQGVTGWQDYTGTALGVSSTFWAGITTRNNNSGAQFAVNWDNNGGVPSGFRIRSQDDNYGSWGQWRSVAFIDATVKLSGDTMTGTLNLPSNGLAVGTSQLVVSGGNVGIGTVVPDTALNIVGTGGGDDDLHIDSYTNSQEGTVMLRRARGTAAAPSPLLSGDRIGFYTFRGYTGSAFADLARIQSTTEADLATSASANLQFITTENGVQGERMRITASGTVLVGTTTPAAGVRMDIFGDLQVGAGGAAQTIRFRTTNTDSGFIRFNSTADTAGNSYLEIGTTDNNDEPITFTQSGNERMRIGTNGGLGIGTSAPTTKLEVRSATTGALTAFTQATTNAGILIDTDIVDATHGPGVFWKSSNNNPTKPKAGVWMYQENGPGSWLMFGTSNSYVTGITNTAMAINPSGSVGIGTTTPSRTLHVNGDSYINAIQGGQNNGAGNFHLDAWSSGADRSVYLNWAGGTGGAKVGNGSSAYGPIAASAFNVSSDRRLKENIKPIQNPLEKILKIDTVTFTWKDQTRNKMEGERIGLIAQNVQQVFPQAVKLDHGENTLPGGTRLVNYPDLVSPIIAALKEFYALWFSDSKELHKTIDEQKRELASVKEQVEVLKAKSSGLEEQNKALKDYLCEKDPSAKICK